MDSFQEKVSKIPGDEEGFWKRGSEDTYQLLGHILLAKGLTEEDALEFLSRAYWAAAECYGG